MSSESNTGSIGDNNHRFWYKQEEMNSKIFLLGRCVHSCWANGFLRGRALSGVGSFKEHMNEEKKKIDAWSTCSAAARVSRGRDDPRRAAAAAGCTSVRAAACERDWLFNTCGASGC